jgi:hypothetical protein
MRDCTLELDGAVIIERGRVVVPALAPARMAQAA